MTLPNHWRNGSVADLIDGIDSGKNLRCEERPPTLGEIGIVKISAVTWGTFDASKSKTVVSGVHLSESTKIRAGDLLISRANTLELVGATVVVEQAPTNLHLSDKVLRLRATSGWERWLNLFLNSPQGRSEIESRATGNQLSMRNIGQDAIRSIPLPIPPLAEQRRIVAQIEALFARTSRARADLERIAPLSRRHRDRTLANAFDIGTPTPIAELASAVFDGPFGSNLKSDDYTDSGTRVVRLENIGHLRFIGEKETFITDEKANGLRRHHLYPDDVLFSSFIDKEVRVCLFPSGQQTSAINKADCFCVRVDTRRADPRYVALRLASPVTYDDMRDAVHGATRPRIGITDLKQYVINAPALAEQTYIAERVEGQHEVSNLIQREAARALALLDRLEQSILASAFRGELVPQDPAEAAGALNPAARGQDALIARRQRTRAAAA